MKGKTTNHTFDDTQLAVNNFIKCFLASFKNVKEVHFVKCYISHQVFQVGDTFLSSGGSPKANEDWRMLSPQSDSFLRKQLFINWLKTCHYLWHEASIMKFAIILRSRSELE